MIHKAMKIVLAVLKFAACNETRKAVELFYSVDTNRDLQLSVDEVSSWIEKTSALDRKIRTAEILKAYDDNENGRVDLHELKYHTKELDEETQEKVGLNFMDRNTHR